MGAEHEGESLDRILEQEWQRFELRLAAACAELEDDYVGVQLIEADDEGEGAAPYAQVMVDAAGELRAEVVSNFYLDDRWQLDAAQVEALRSVGWRDPDGEEHNFWWDGHQRDADEVARLVVLALRGVFGCLSPGLLAGVGTLPVPPDVVGPDDDEDEGEGSIDERGEMPHDRAHLLHLVKASLTDFTWVADDDGGALLVDVGPSSVRVEVDDDQAALTLSVVLAVEVPDTPRLAVELGLLNRSHPVATFLARDGVVSATYVLPVPVLVPAQLRVLVHLMGAPADRISDDLITRCGGSRPADIVADPDEPGRSERSGPGPTMASHAPVVDLELAALLELMADGAVGPAEVAVLFERDRHAIVTRLVGLRRGDLAPDPQPLDAVLDALRAGLRHVVGVAVRAERDRERRPRAGSHQLALMPDPEGELPLSWSGEESLG